MAPNHSKPMQYKLGPHLAPSPSYRGGTTTTAPASTSSSSKRKSADSTVLTRASAQAESNVAALGDVPESEYSQEEMDDVIFSGARPRQPPVDDGTTELFDSFHALGKKKRAMNVLMTIIMTRTDIGESTFAMVLSGATIELRRVLNLGKVYSMLFRQPWDLPRHFDKNGKPVPSFACAQPGWWLLKADVRNIDEVIASFRRNIASGVFNQRLHFDYKEIAVDRKAAMKILLAVRFRQGVEDRVDVTGIN